MNTRPMTACKHYYAQTVRFKGRGSRLGSQLEQRLQIPTVPDIMANGERSVVLLRPKYRIFSNLFSVLGTKVDLFLDIGPHNHRNKAT